MNEFVRNPMADLFVGQIVHYIAYGTPGNEFQPGAHRAAVVTALDNVGIGIFAERPEVSLCVLNPSGIFFDREVPYDSKAGPGTWHHRDECRMP